MKQPKPIADYAFHDPRSIAAQLRGRGDGAEFDWLQFRDGILREHPGLDDAEIGALYAEHLRVAPAQRELDKTKEAG